MIAFKVLFWVLVVSTFLRMVDLSKDHPRTQIYTTKIDILSLIINIGWCIWVGISIWIAG
jgi:hypothetical protein